MILVDASAIVEVITESPRSNQVLERLHDDDLVAPELIDVEVCSAMARLERAGAVSAQDADEALSLYADMPIHRVRHRELLDDAWRRRHSIRVTDAFYVACALAVNAAILTLDKRLIRAAPPGVRFLMLSD